MSVNVQGTQTYITDVPTTPWADCDAAVTALLAGKKATCIQAYGDLERTRDITEYSCQDSNNSEKAAGKISYGDITISLLLDTADTEGQKLLFDAMENNTPVAVGFESPNKPTSGTSKNGDIIWTNCVLAGDKIGYPDGGKITYELTLSPYGGFNRCPAA